MSAGVWDAAATPPIVKHGQRQALASADSYGCTLQVKQLLDLGKAPLSRIINKLGNLMGAVHERERDFSLSFAADWAPAFLAHAGKPLRD